MNIAEAINQYTQYRIDLGGKFRINGYVLRSFGHYVGEETDIMDINPHCESV